MESRICYNIDKHGNMCTRKSTHNGCYVYCSNHKHLISKTKLNKIKELTKRLDSYDEESLEDLVTIYNSIFNYRFTHINKNELK
jgi:hypothetical protein